MSPEGTFHAPPSKDHFSSSKPPVQAPNKDRAHEIQNTVAQYFGLKVDEMLRPSRRKELARPRQIAMYFVRKKTSLGYADIGRIFRKRDHTTVLHAVHSIEKRIDTDPDFKQRIKPIEALISDISSSDSEQKAVVAYEKWD